MRSMVSCQCSPVDGWELSFGIDVHTYIWDRLAYTMDAISDWEGQKLI